MNTPEYSLPLSDVPTLRRARSWLMLGVVALGVAGFFAGMLGVTQSRFFYTALVVHVDLSVLVWFLTMACMLFTLSTEGRGLPMVADAAFVSFAVGAVLMALSAFTAGEPYMSNYIPVIHHPMFFLGLSLLLCGVLGITVNQLAGFRAGALKNAQQFGVTSAAVIMLIATLCFVWSQHSLPEVMTGQHYYDCAFWGGGHVLQFVHTQLMLVCWLWLAGAAGIRIRLSDGVITGLYALGLLSALVAPFIYLLYDVASDEHRNAFTLLMKHTNGLPALIAGVFIVYSFVMPHLLRHLPQKTETPQQVRGDNIGMTLPKICLLMSILLFFAGGALGYLIAGSNVTVPAHYHGSIVGVTLAFMGVCYLLLPSLGYEDVLNIRLAFLQPLIYGGGQLCWMAGMAMLGAHGVPRKTPGSADTMGAFASHLKHGGDGLAMIGGLLFVFVVLRAVYRGKTEAI